MNLDRIDTKIANIPVQVVSRDSYEIFKLLTEGVRFSPQGCYENIANGQNVPECVTIKLHLQQEMSSRFCGRSRCQHPSSTQNWHLTKVWEMKSNFMGNEIKCLNIEWEMKSNFMENGFHFQNM